MSIRFKTSSPSTKSCSFLVSLMSEPSPENRLYQEVGKCLSTWNRIEAELLRLLDYAHSYDGHGHIETELGYWAVVSFEARLKWCSTVLAFRLKSHPELLSRWNSLSSRISEKAAKRAEIAHGTVVLTTNGCFFIPYYFKRWADYWSQTPELDEPVYLPDEFFPFAKSLTETEINGRSQSFKLLRRDMVQFLEDWIDHDIEAGLLQSPHEAASE